MRYSSENKTINSRSRLRECILRQRYFNARKQRSIRIIKGYPGNCWLSNCITSKILKICHHANVSNFDYCSLWGWKAGRGAGGGYIRGGMHEAYCTAYCTTVLVGRCGSVYGEMLFRWDNSTRLHTTGIQRYSWQWILIGYECVAIPRLVVNPGVWGISV